MTFIIIIKNDSLSISPAHLFSSKYFLCKLYREEKYLYLMFFFEVKIVCQLRQ